VPHKLYRIGRYALFLLDRFKYLILLAWIVFIIATLILYRFHPDQLNATTRKDFLEVSFCVFELMFASQPAMNYPTGSWPAQLVFFALPILNVLGLAAAVAQFSQILFDRDLYNRAQAKNADYHLILCGLGRLGREVLKQLDRRYDLKNRRDVVIVESGAGVEALDSDYVRREPIVPVVHGSMTDPVTLETAGIKKAVAILMLTGDDTTNLEAGLLARDLNPNVRVVLRMSNKRITQRLDAMFRKSGVQNFQMIDSVEGSAPQCLDLCVLPNGAHPLECTDGNLIDLSTCTGHIIVCGLGRLGFGIVRMLRGKLPVVVIDSGEKLHYADEPEITSAPAIPIIRGDMTTKRVMQQARVEHATVVLIMTPNDTQNLEAAMVVHELNPRAHVVMRITNSRISRRLDRVLRDVFGQTLRVIDPAEHAAPYFVDAVTSAYEPGAKVVARSAQAEAERNDLVGL
jgi:voltage-gated potassium channel Kch